MSKSLRSLSHLRQTASRSIQIRAFTNSTFLNADPVKDYPSDTHVNSKSHRHDPQSDAANRAKGAKESGGGDTATSQKDVTGSHQRTREEFPEAPDTIGMQDERGKKGA